MRVVVVVVAAAVEAADVLFLARILWFWFLSWWIIRVTYGTNFLIFFFLIHNILISIIMFLNIIVWFFFAVFLLWSFMVICPRSSEHIWIRLISCLMMCSTILWQKCRRFLRIIGVLRVIIVVVIVFKCKEFGIIFFNDFILQQDVTQQRLLLVFISILNTSCMRSWLG